jgi:hypothetical protein
VGLAFGGYTEGSCCQGVPIASQDDQGWTWFHFWSRKSRKGAEFQPCSDQKLEWFPSLLLVHDASLVANLGLEEPGQMQGDGIGTWFQTLGWAIAFWAGISTSLQVLFFFSLPSFLSVLGTQTQGLAYTLPLSYTSSLLQNLEGLPSCGKGGLRPSPHPSLRLAGVSVLWVPSPRSLLSTALLGDLISTSLSGVSTQCFFPGFPNTPSQACLFRNNCCWYELGETAL